MLTADEAMLLFNHLKIDQSSEYLSRTDRYAKGHLLLLDSASPEIDAILNKVALGTGLSQERIDQFKTFAIRANSVVEVAD